jgi:hypothetical protein
MSDQAKCNPSSSSGPSPSTPEGWDESAGFRETMLHLFTRAEDAAVLRRFGAMLHELSVQLAHLRPKPADYGIRADLRAIAADLRHAEGFLALLGHEQRDSSLAAEEVALSVLAERLAGEVGRIAGEIEAGAG